MRNALLFVVTLLAFLGLYIQEVSGQCPSSVAVSGTISNLCSPEGTHLFTASADNADSISYSVSLKSGGPSVYDGEINSSSGSVIVNTTLVSKSTYTVDFTAKKADCPNVEHSEDVYILEPELANGTAGVTVKIDSCSGGNKNIVFDLSEVFAPGTYTYMAATDVCVSSSGSPGSCDIPVSNEVTSTYASLNAQVPTSGDYTISMTINSCDEEVTLASRTLTVPEPTGGSFNDDTYVDVVSTTDGCAANLELECRDFVPSPYLGYIPQYQVCYSTDNFATDTGNCAVFNNIRPRIDGLQFNTYYDLKVATYDSCAGAGDYYVRNATTDGSFTGEFDVSRAIITIEPDYSTADYDIETCSASVTVSWSDFYYKDSGRPFKGGYDVCVSSPGGSCDFGQLTDTMETSHTFTNVAGILGTTISVTVTPVYCDGNVADDQKTTSLNVAPASSPVLAGRPYLQFETKLSTGGGECKPVVVVTVPKFVEADGSTLKGEYGACYAPSGVSCADGDFIWSTSNEIELPVASDLYYFNGRARNCHGTTPVQDVGMYNVVLPPSPSLNDGRSVTPAPAILVDQDCSNKLQSTISWRGFSGLIEDYEFCADTTCKTVTGLSTEHTFLSFGTYNISVTAQNCVGSVTYWVEVDIADTIVTNDAEAYTTFEVVPTSTCSYDVTANFENFEMFSSFKYCLDQASCTPSSDAPSASHVFTDVTSGTYNLGVNGVACDGVASQVITDKVTLYPIDSPSKPVVSTISDACQQSFTVDWTGIHDQNIWFTGYVDVCLQSVSEGDCTDDAAFKTFTGSSTEFASKYPGNYSLVVRAVNCNGMSEFSSVVTMPEPQAPDTTGADLVYSVSYSSGGCDRALEVEALGFSGARAYKFCVSDKIEFDEVCGNITAWDDRQNKHTFPIVDGDEHLLRVGAVGVGCKDVFSEPIFLDAYIPKRTLESIPVNMDQATVSYQVYVPDYDNSGIDVELFYVRASVTGVTLNGAPYSGLLNYCLGNTTNDCDVFTSSSGPSVDIAIDNEFIESDTETFYLRVTPSRPCIADETAIKIIEITFNTVIPSDPLDVHYEVLPGCSGAINISWTDPGTPSRIMIDSIRSGVPYSDWAESNALFAIIDDLISGDSYSFSVYAERTVASRSDPYSFDIIMPPPNKKPDATDAKVDMELTSDSECNFRLNVDANGFANFTSSAASAGIDYCVGRNEDRCDTSLGTTSDTSFLIDRYLFGRTYHASAIAYNCPDVDAKATPITKQLEVPVPSPLSTTNAVITASISHTGSCAATISGTISGVKVGTASYVGKYFYCIGTSPNKCDRTSWIESATASFSTQLAVRNNLNYYVTAYAYNCAGKSEMIVSNKLTSGNYGCCFTAFSDAQFTVTKKQATCTPDGASVSFSLGGTARAESVVVCAGSKQGACDLAPETSITVLDKSNVVYNFKPSSLTSKSVYLKVTGKNCAGSLPSHTLVVDARPTTSGKLTISNKKDCSFTALAPVITGASKYLYCVGSAAGQCDLIDYTEFAYSSGFSVANIEAPAAAFTAHITVVGRNCFGDATLTTSVSMDKCALADNSDVSASSLAVPSFAVFAIALVAFFF